MVGVGAIRKGGALGVVFGLAEALNIFPFQRSAACVAHQTNQLRYIHQTISLISFPLPVFPCSVLCSAQKEAEGERQRMERG